MSESTQIATATVQSLLVILNIVGNSLVCVIIVKNQEMRTSINYLLINLAIADMTVGIFLASRHIFIYTHIFPHPDGVTGNVLCILLTGGTWGWIEGSSSVFSLVFIAIERYYAVVHPHGNKGRLTKGKIKVIITCSWIFGVLLNIPWVLLTKYSKEMGKCTHLWPAKWMGKAYSVTWLLMMAVFPVCLMTALYIRVVYTLWFKHEEHSQQQGVKKVRKRVTLTDVIVSVIFGVCYLTNSCDYVMDYYHPPSSSLPWIVGFTMTFFNSAINPIMYTLRNQRFREKLKTMLSCTFRPTTNMMHFVREPYGQMMEPDTTISCRE